MLDTPEFTILKENSPWHADDQWQMEKDGKGFALQVSVSQAFLPHDVFLGYLMRLSEYCELLVVYMLNMGKQNRDPYIGQVGLHGLYVAGYVSISYRDQERKDDCGKCACSLQPHEV